MEIEMRNGKITVTVTTKKAKQNWLLILYKNSIDAELLANCLMMSSFTKKEAQIASKKANEGSVVLGKGSFNSLNKVYENIRLITMNAPIVLVRNTILN